MAALTQRLRQLQRSQLSVQALTRLANVGVFLLASWGDRQHLALVAMQGALLAIPYTLLESLVGRPLSAGVVPERWDVESWAMRATAAMLLPVGLVSVACATVALPGTAPADRLIMIVPVLLQLPLEGLFWATARTRSRRRANLLPQLTAGGTLLCGAAFVALHLRMDVAAVPAQLAVLGWALTLRRPSDGSIRPPALASVRIGAVYCVAAAIDLVYVVALPSAAGALVGAAALVVMRAMDLAFGPFHVALSATTREDVVAGRRSRLLTGTRGLTVLLLAGVSAAVLASPWLRGLIAEDLARLGTLAVATYCGYKGMLMLSTWLSTRHMIWAPPGQFLVSAIGSRVVACASLAVAVLWVRAVPDFMVQLLIGEAAVVGWFVARILVITGGDSARLLAMVGGAAAAPGEPGR